MYDLGDRRTWWLQMLWGALLVVALVFLPAADAVASGMGDSPWPEGEAGQALGELRQDVLPSLAARRSAAEERAEAIRAFEAGQGSLGEALPDVTGSALHEVPILDARLSRLDDRGEDRAIEKVAPVPEFPEPWRSRAVEALAATHAAEATADGLERQVLLGLRAWLRQHPWLDGASLDVLRAPFEATIVAARGVATDAPDRQARLDAARLASDDLARLDEILGMLRRAALVSDVELPDVSGDLAALRGAGSDGAALRLALLASVAPAHQDVQTHLSAWVGVQASQLTARPIPVASDLPTVAVAQAALATASSRAAVVPPGLRPLAAAKVARAQAIVDATEAEAAAAVLGETSDTTREEAAVEREAQDAASALTAALIEARAPALDRVRALKEDLDARNEAIDASRAEAQATLATAEDVLGRIGSPEIRRSEIDEVYAALRSLLRQLRESARLHGGSIATLEQAREDGLERIAEERNRITSERRVLADLSDHGVQERRRDALDKWSAVLDEEKALLGRRVEVVGEARDITLQTVDQAATLRGTLAKRVSNVERAEDASGRLPEMVDELSVMGPTFMAIQRGRFASASGEPWWWLGAIQDVLLGSLGFLFTALLWWLARRYAGVMVGLALDRVARWRDWRRDDLVTVEDPLQRAFITLIDVVAAWALFMLQPAGLPELGVALVLLFEVQLVRLELAIFDLLVAKPGERRPTLIRLDVDGRRALRRVVLVLGLWLAIRRVLLSFAHDVLHGYATEFVVGFSTWVALAILILVLLYTLAPHVRTRISASSRETSLSRWLTAKPPFGLGGFQAAAGLTFILFVGVRGLWFRVARGGVGAPVFAALERLRVGRAVNDEKIAPPEPLPSGVVDALRDRAADRAFQDRPAAHKALVQAVLAWKKERRQGLIAFLGDSGEGRHAALEHWRADWEEKGLDTTWVTLDHRLATERDAFIWLAHVFELSEVPDSTDAAVAALGERLTEGVFIVRGLHLAFLRTVGGFDALRTLLDVLHADGVDRCWILVSYRPAWRYLERLGTALNVHLVRSVVDLPGLDAEQLRSLTEELATEAGYTLDFEAMAATGAFAGEHDVELQRGIESFYRLLAVSSSGNPSVALELWTGCLSLGPDQSLVVRISDDMRMGLIVDLSDEHLFVLAAIRTQGELDEAELAEVLNMGLAKVRALVRQMVSAGLLARSDHGVHVDRRQLPAVTLTLRRRHFVHWS